MLPAMYIYMYVQWINFSWIQCTGYKVPITLYVHVTVYAYGIKFVLCNQLLIILGMS